MRGSIFILLLVVVSSCSPKWHINRAIMKDPSILQRDTLHIRDTIRFTTDRVEVDSVFIISNDTIIIKNERLTIKHWIHNDSIFIEGECDSIIIEKFVDVKIPYDRWIMPEQSWMPPKWLIWILFAGIIFGFVRKYFNN